MVKKGSAARFAFAAAIFGDSLEAIFWLQLRHAVNHLMNKLINKSPQKASVQASISELDDASILSRITSKGKSIPGARKRDAVVIHLVFRHHSYTYLQIYFQILNPLVMEY